MASFHNMPVYNWDALGLVFATCLSTTGVHLASFGHMLVYNRGALG